jgi:hypothetical protein
MIWTGWRSPQAGWRWGIRLGARDAVLTGRARVEADWRCLTEEGRRVFNWGAASEGFVWLPASAVPER